MEDCYEKMSNAVPEASVASADPCIGKRTRKASARRTKGDRTTGTECVPQNGGRTITLNLVIKLGPRTAVK